MSNLWYFGLAPQKSRYTEQLSKRWMPRAFNYVFNKSSNSWCDVEETTGVDLTKGLNDDVGTGVVLDDYSRVVHCYRQCEKFAMLISLGEVKNGDAIFLQDYWTPGIEGILYSLSIRGISVRLYAMCHAQSVDVYDFTHAMAYWIRNAELSMDRYIEKNGGAIFVASSVHRRQLRDANFKAPIHVMGLPFDYYDVRPRSKDALQPSRRQKKVVFASRMHPEKQPWFMLDVAEEVLKSQEDARWVITTSAQDIQTSAELDKRLRERIASIRSSMNNRLEVRTGLSKEEYYQELSTAMIIFNCSLQDYVSWTLLEGITHGCIPVYPNFRSFPECLPEDFLYEHRDIHEFHVGEEFSCTFDAVCAINDIFGNGGDISPPDTALRCNVGRLLEASIIDWELTNRRNMQKEQNVWELPIDVVHLIGSRSRRR
ncbi:MAG: hypothetical protein GF334_13420 [Candidatus Altiarchaeales archaeon]|nr:hypothetical protein [Candidatus Altiarchaeales archaeon]